MDRERITKDGRKLKMSLQETKLWESLSEPRGPLASIQLSARESLKSRGMPAASEETWRLTDFQLLESILHLPLSSSASESNCSSVFDMPSPPTEGFRLMLSPGSEPLGLESLPKGFNLLNSEELKEVLGKALEHCGSNEDWSVGLNNSCVDNVLALRVEGIDLPSLELVISGKDGEFSATRVILLVEKNTHLNFLQVLLGAFNSAHSHLIEIHLAENASLNHEWLAFGGGKSSFLSHIAVEQQPKSDYSFTSIQKGWLFSRFEPCLVQVNGQASTKFRGLQIADSNEQIATNSTIRFDGPEGDLDQLHKGIAAGTSHSIFNGCIEVPQPAQRTSAAQLSRNLLLSNRSRVDTKPELKIVADDVRCTHGATVTELQEEQLFYMRSRGIEQIAAANLLLRGYCQEIISSLPMSFDRWKVLEHVLEGLRG